MDGISLTHQFLSMMLSMCRTQFILGPLVTKFAEDKERGWVDFCIKHKQWCFQWAEDIMWPFMAQRTRLVWEEVRYRKARGQRVRWRPMSSDQITPVCGNLYQNRDQLNRHDSPVIRCDAVIYLWCQRCCKGTKVLCFVCAAWAQVAADRAALTRLRRLVSSLIAD